MNRIYYIDGSGQIRRVFVNGSNDESIQPIRGAEVFTFTHLAVSPFEYYEVTDSTPGVVYLAGDNGSTYGVYRMRADGSAIEDMNTGTETEGLDVDKQTFTIWFKQGSYAYSQVYGEAKQSRMSLGAGTIYDLRYEPTYPHVYVSTGSTISRFEIGSPFGGNVLGASPDASDIASVAVDAINYPAPSQRTWFTNYWGTDYISYSAGLSNISHAVDAALPQGLDVDISRNIVYFSDTDSPPRIAKFDADTAVVTTVLAATTAMKLRLDTGLYPGSSSSSATPQTSSSSSPSAELLLSSSSLQFAPPITPAPEAYVSTFVKNLTRRTLYLSWFPVGTSPLVGPRGRHVAPQGGVKFADNLLEYILGSPHWRLQLLEDLQERRIAIKLCPDTYIPDDEIAALITRNATFIRCPG